NSMLENGIAQVTQREFPPGLSIAGEEPKAYLMRLRPWQGKFLQIPKSMAHEYEAITGLAPAFRLGPYTKAAEFFTNQSVKGLAEGSTHLANVATDMFLGIGPTGNPIINALLKAGFRADLIAKIPATLIQALGDRRADMLRLAEMGAAKQPYTGTIGWIINKL